LRRDTIDIKNVSEQAGKWLHPTIRNDPLWEFQTYRKALFLYDPAWEDCQPLMKDQRG